MSRLGTVAWGEAAAPGSFIYRLNVATKVSYVLLSSASAKSVAGAVGYRKMSMGSQAAVAQG